MQGEPWEPQPETDRWELAIAAQKEVAIDSSPGAGFLYRRGRLLVHPELLRGKRTDWRYGLELLRSARAEFAPDESRRTSLAVGLDLLAVDDKVAVPSLARNLRKIAPSAASVEHFLVADPQRMHGCDPAIPADRPTDIPDEVLKRESGLTVAVLDTGVWPDWGLPVSVDPADEERLDDDGDQLLDPAAGHGTFVTGVILRYAPTANVIVRRILTTPAGLASELDIAQALLDLPEVDVINCSFGGPAQADGSHLSIDRALQRLSPKTVVVAAAGNHGGSRPHWPAASKLAIAVGAVKQPEGSKDWELTDYTGRGTWVNASAPGTAVSAFVKFAEQGTGARTFLEGAEWTGTSFATPAVAGAILQLAANEGIPVKEAAYRLIDDPSRERILDGGTLVLP
ncbi:MAG: S8/S53 family peptidase [Solirubrobacteraceae bacterium]|nr:S8/S53 family peptidase [Solirubrobacteraceae bacterium]